MRLNGVHNTSLITHTNPPDCFLDRQSEVRPFIAVVHPGEARQVITLNCCAKLKSLFEHLAIASAYVGIWIVCGRLRWFRAYLQEEIGGA
jgi:hypothetical protein